jgi:adenine-specific DNA-methyltransferase
MILLKKVDDIRLKANKALNPKTKSSLGQFFTSAPICMYMSSLFEDISGDVSVLDPGCGPCSLTAAFVEEAIKRKKCKSLKSTVYDIEESIKPYILDSLELIKEYAENEEVSFESVLQLKDFILSLSDTAGLFENDEKYTHVIINPPYKKISSSSEHRKALRARDIETVNLYSGFVALAIQQLQENGEIVAIIPRSFCNGPYYQPFRELILKETSIKKIHIFDSRTNAFSGDDVLQENIIIHLVKGGIQGDVAITSSPTADFLIDEGTETISATDMTVRTVCFEKIVQKNDPYKFIHIAANERDQNIIDRLSGFTHSLSSLDIQVSTGPVVDFRLKDELRENLTENSCPLIFPIHLKEKIEWPLESKKPNAINISKKTLPFLWKQKGYFLTIKRLSSKEEARRIVAKVFESNLPSELVGFDNKLNIFHFNKEGLSRDLAAGLYCFLNSTLVDKYYRLFGGHTQVNATDLRNLHYPSLESLEKIGKKISDFAISQDKIDELIDKELQKLTGVKNNPLVAQTKIDDAIKIITELGFPSEQQNERSALTLLALLEISPNGSWGNGQQNLLGVTPIMDWCRDVYGKEYAPNSRETFRRQTLHQFLDGGLCLYNPDKPDRAVNSPKACYQIAPEAFNLISTFGKKSWKKNLTEWLKNQKTLVEQYAMAREKELVPLVLPNGTKIKLSPGIHSQLIHDIVTVFGPIFAPASEVIYLGDTGAKEDFFDKDRLAELGVTVNRKGKLPDVVLYWPEKDWLLLIESVTSHGPVDGKRHNELTKLFKDSKPGLVYVTAFPDRKTMAKYVAAISWETEVWVSEAPTHMIHFNGDRFLGPHQ